MPIFWSNSSKKNVMIPCHGLYAVYACEGTIEIWQHCWWLVNRSFYFIVFGKDRCFICCLHFFRSIILYTLCVFFFGRKCFSIFHRRLITHFAFVLVFPLLYFYKYNFLRISYAMSYQMLVQNCYNVYNVFLNHRLTFVPPEKWKQKREKKTKSHGIT